MATTNEIRKPKAMNIFLWIAQIILGIMFIGAGYMKGFQPMDEVKSTINWANDIPEGMVRFIGISELLIGFGLLLPSILRIKPVLTPIAAVALMTIMLMAAIFHVTRSEYPQIIFNLIVAGISAFIGWGRMRKAPILPR